MYHTNISSSLPCHCASCRLQYISSLHAHAAPCDPLKKYKGGEEEGHVPPWQHIIFVLNQ